MRCIRPGTLIAKFKYIIGLALAFVTLLTYMSAGKTVTTDKVFFEVSPKLTTESTNIEINVTNKSIYAISYEIGIDKLEKEENGEWVELKFDERINNYPAMKRPFHDSSFFPTETVKYSYSCESHFGQETAPKGNYRITFLYNVYRGGELSNYTCEFSVE